MGTCEQDINIVIPNYNGKDFLRTCLASIQGQTCSSYQVTVVDNGSADGSVEFIRDRYPAIRLIVLPANKGFSAAVNAGIDSSAHPFVFLLNNDTELAADCLEQLLLAAAVRPEFDFFAPKMLSYYERDILDGAGDGFLRGGAGYRLGTMEKDGEAYNRPGPVFGARAGAALYRRSLFERLGSFDDDFFAYLEDVDLNLRANRAGLRCFYVPGAVVYHIGSATTGSRFNELTIRLSTRNSFYVLLKNYSLPLFLRFFPVICVYQFFWFLFVVKKRQLRPYLAGLLQAAGSLPRMRKKYRALRRNDRLTTTELANCLGGAERQVIESIMRRRREQGRGNMLLLTYRFLFL
ncbi:MAG TPA: glycosyltransferase family 2 protein [Desulfobacteraceae bacterium]|nr:glycosyltransferase family 2 protein [Desulfobacteraceae bacterium]